MGVIGMIGLGQMGLPMAANLMKADHTVVGYRRGECADFRALGGIPAASAREVAERCDIILCCIPNEPALEDVVSGVHGIAIGDCSNRIVVELSTLSTSAKTRQADALAAKGGTMLDCAISGIPRMVAERQGVVFASGDEPAFERVRGVLDVVTAKLFYMGAFGTALNAKLCANMLVAINIASTAETLAFGRKLGVDPLRLVEALKDGAGGSLQFTVRAARMATGDWKRVMGSTAMLAKDLHLIEEKSGEIGCPTPILMTAARIYDEAMAGGYAETDVAAVYAIVARRAGLDVPGEESDKTENG
ncbi:MAG: NAD(P)-dependent oxidoreductase [Mesorhizobium sp.]|nr:NAD(P)-dependent oxidoreductase [Mesorhizobium sp.]RWM45485.1 MAG: NAD(P)-dependent oxidoreductase [Mesorhizobium sp.]RWM58195.1 MAG: NAD(P)-dependent oxidoreductase [Mesorhizobium sp.]RWM58640.1 MAG: NAD(P)-dependent oxidoreductase [Mesorhizobium sp.]TIO70061.1 MAG: NAD(P)-dependent oxidoreductase [Mesorhizobium sp.]TIR29379.1 MAG: NAD(P)-dependent oxidoreductase [Mesorhizobium sp.]